MSDLVDIKWMIINKQHFIHKLGKFNEMNNYLKDKIPKLKEK